MPTMQDVRKKYPQYDDMSDADLADALHRKFYSDMPRADFDAKIGLGGGEKVVTEPTSFREAQRKSAAEDRGALAASTTAGAQGWSWGASDEIMAGAFTPLEMAIGALTGEDADKGLLDRARDAYSRGLELQRTQIKEARENHPAAALAGEIAGGAATAGAGMGVAKSTIGKMAVGAGEGVAAGGVSGFMSGEGMEDRLEKAETGAQIGAGVGAALPAVGAVVGAVARGAKTFVEPFTEAGRDRIAARRLEKGATDPEALRAALDDGTEELVSGSAPTTFQATGDMGIGSMERQAQNRRPDLFMQRRADQNSARVGALEGVQVEGSPESVADAIRQRFQMIDDETQAALDAARSAGDAMRRGVDDETGAALAGATKSAQDETSALGAGSTPDAAGDRMRGALEAARAQAKAKERELWNVVDPDGTLVTGTESMRSAAKGIVDEIPDTAEPLSAREALIYDTIGDLGETASFKRVEGLRRRLNDALKEERREKGETEMYRRLSIVRGALEQDLDGAIVQKIAQEQDAVANGMMRADDTTEARILRTQEDESTGQRSATEAATATVGRSLGAGPSADGARGPGALSRGAGAEGQERGGFSDAPRNQGLPRDGGVFGAGNEGASPPPGAYGADSRTVDPVDASEGAGLPVRSPGEESRRFGDSYRPANDTEVPGLRGGLRGDAPGGLTLADIKAKRPLDRYFVHSGDGQAFVPAQPGKPDLGTAPNVDGDGTDIPIRVRRGDLTRHIASDVHYKDAEVLGYSDPWELVQDVSANWTQMRAGDKGRVLLVKPAPDANGVAVVELAPVDGGQYWRVVTAGRRADKQLGEQIRVRTLLPDSASGNDASLIAHSPQGRQEAGLAQDRIGPEDMPTSAAGQDALPDPDAAAARVQGWANDWRGGGKGAEAAPPPAPAADPNFDVAARDRLKAATTATRERAETFDNKTLAPLRKRPSTTAPYDVGSSSVPSTIFKPGAKGFDSVETYRRAVGNDPEAMGAIRDYAVDRLRLVAGRPDGTLDPAKAKTWLNVHKDALRAFPELDAQIRRAAGASDSMAGADAARRDAMKGVAGPTEAETLAEKGRAQALADADRGTLGKLRAESDRTEIGKLVGKAFDATASAQEMLKVKMAIGNDAAAREGLKRAVVDEMARRFVGTSEAGVSGIGTLKSDGFQQFVRKNKAALKGAGFGDEQIDIFERIAADLQQSNRSNIALKNPGGSDTAQNVLSVKPDDQPMTILGKVLADMSVSKAAGVVGSGTGAGFIAGGGGLLGGAAIAGAGVATQVLAKMRAAGLEKVEDIVADALLHPERARLLLSKATGKGEQANVDRLVKLYTNAATVAGTLEATSGPQKEPTEPTTAIPAPADRERADRERADSPRLTPDDRASPIPSDLIDDGKAVMDGERVVPIPTPAERGKPGEAKEKWSRFPSQSGTLNVPRAEMPQIKSEHRGALVNFLAARGIEHSDVTVPAGALKATQAEFSPERVEAAKERKGGDRAILVSSDWQVIDGHHQWLAKKDAGEDVRVIRLDAPIAELLDVVREFPSAETEAAAKSTSKLAELEERAKARRAARAAA